MILQEVVSANVQRDVEEGAQRPESETNDASPANKLPPHPDGGAENEGVSEETAAAAGPAKAAPRSESSETDAGHGADHDSRQNGTPEAKRAEDRNLDSLSADPKDEKIGPHLPTLLERLRSIGEDHAEGEKPSPPSRGLG